MVEWWKRAADTLLVLSTAAGGGGGDGGGGGGGGGGARHKYVCIIRCDLPHYPTRSDSCFITMSTLPCRSSCSFPPCERPIQVDGTKPFRSPTGGEPEAGSSSFVSEGRRGSSDDRCLRFNSTDGINERDSIASADGREEGRGGGGSAVIDDGTTIRRTRVYATGSSTRRRRCS